jgi:hypothetical protein
LETRFATHHAHDVEGNHGQQCVDEEQENVDGISHPIGLALTERLRAAGSAEDAAGDVGKQMDHRETSLYVSMHANVGPSRNWSKTQGIGDILSLCEPSFGNEYGASNRWLVNQ